MALYGILFGYSALTQSPFDIWHGRDVTCLLVSPVSDKPIPLRVHFLSSSPARLSKETVTVNGRKFDTDEWMNTPQSIIDAVPRRLHLKANHPVAITRQLIESCFPGYKTYNDLFPVVSVTQNFDSLDFPLDHPGRSRTDTYYLNEKTVLRTHTSAHQADTFRTNLSDGFLISADVYRRDAVDRSHYPVFHQMEGARVWDRKKLDNKVAEAAWADVEAIARHDVKVEDPNPTVHADRNPLQESHELDEVEAIATHLKRSLEAVVVKIFLEARKAGKSYTNNYRTLLTVTSCRSRSKRSKGGGFTKGSLGRSILSIHLPILGVGDILAESMAGGARLWCHPPRYPRQCWGNVSGRMGFRHGT